MTDHDPLLAAIIADPDEDTPRLVFADWLDEHGEPERAEFIRVTIGGFRPNDLHATGGAPRADSEVMRQTIETWRACGWQPALPPGVVWPRIDLAQRGMVET